MNKSIALNSEVKCHVTLNNGTFIKDVAYRGGDFFTPNGMKIKLADIDKCEWLKGK